jgi:adenine-specific DNA-methyltransferase
MDEMFGEANRIALISVAKTSSATSEFLAGVTDFILFYAKNEDLLKYRAVLRTKSIDGEGAEAYVFAERPTGERRRLSPSEALPPGDRAFRLSDLRSARPPGDFPVFVDGKKYVPNRGVLENR